MHSISHMKMSNTSVRLHNLLQEAIWRFQAMHTANPSSQLITATGFFYHSSFKTFLGWIKHLLSIMDRISVEHKELSSCHALGLNKCGTLGLIVGRLHMGLVNLDNPERIIHRVTRNTSKFDIAEIQFSRGNETLCAVAAGKKVGLKNMNSIVKNSMWMINDILLLGRVVGLEARGWRNDSFGNVGQAWQHHYRFELPWATDPSNHNLLLWSQHPYLGHSVSNPPFNSSLNLFLSNGIDTNYGLLTFYSLFSSILVALNIPQRLYQA